MVNITQSNLVIVGLDKVFWKGKEVLGIRTIELKKASHHMECKLTITRNTNEQAIIDEIKASGVIVKEVK